jgi:hypothetical protein
MDVLKAGDIAFDSFYEEYCIVEEFLNSKEAMVYSLYFPHYNRYIADREYLEPVSSLVKELL